MNRESFTKELFNLSVSSLKSMVLDIRAQVQIGLMSSKDAHDQLNCIAAVIMTKELEGIEGEIDGTSANNYSAL